MDPYCAKKKQWNLLRRGPIIAFPLRRCCWFLHDLFNRFPKRQADAPEINIIFQNKFISLLTNYSPWYHKFSINKNIYVTHKIESIDVIYRCKTALYYTHTQQAVADHLRARCSACVMVRLVRRTESHIRAPPWEWLTCGYVHTPVVCCSYFRQQWGPAFLESTSAGRYYIGVCR